jgi:ribonuclease HII
MPKSKKSASKENPPWMTVTPAKDSKLTMATREYLEGKIVEHCATKASLEKEAAKPPEQQIDKFDKLRCWHAAYSAAMRHVLKHC